MTLFRVSQQESLCECWLNKLSWVLSELSRGYMIICSLKCVVLWKVFAHVLQSLLFVHQQATGSPHEIFPADGAAAEPVLEDIFGVSSQREQGSQREARATQQDEFHYGGIGIHDRPGRPETHEQQVPEQQVVHEQQAQQAQQAHQQQVPVFAHDYLSSHEDVGYQKEVIQDASRVPQQQYVPTSETADMITAPAPTTPLVPQTSHETTHPPDRAPINLFPNAPGPGAKISKKSRAKNDDLWPTSGFAPQQRATKKSAWVTRGIKCDLYIDELPSISARYIGLSPACADAGIENLNGFRVCIRNEEFEVLKNQQLLLQLDRDRPPNLQLYDPISFGSCGNSERYLILPDKDDDIGPFGPYKIGAFAVDPKGVFLYMSVVNYHLVYRAPVADTPDRGSLGRWSSVGMYG